MKIVDPAFNYDKFGHTYSGYRQTDPRIAAYVNTALRNAKTILNVGAGGGSYEPDNRYVVAVEPSSVMREQRKANNKVPAINAKADNLPFDNNAFDASMAMVTVHHWPDIAKGLQELRRVTTGPVIIMSFDPDALNDFWNAQYFPELIAIEKARYPTVDFIMDALGGNTEVIPVPIPLDCTDGFQEAFYGRPEAFLKKEVRRSQSAWGFLPEETASQLVKRLEDDLNSGEWDRKYGHFRTQPFFTGALRLIVSEPYNNI
jgi:SAM-dependent methyltransferase